MTIEQLNSILKYYPATTEVNIVIGDSLYPAREIYKDDAPFGNLHCVLVIPNESVEIKRPLLI